MTIQDLLDWCKTAKAPTHPEGYPLSAILLLSGPDDRPYDLCIDGVEGHGHEWEGPGKLFLRIVEV